MNGTVSLKNRNISLNRHGDILANSPKGNQDRTKEQASPWWQPSQPTPDRLERTLAIESIQSIASTLLRI